MLHYGEFEGAERNHTRGRYYLEAEEENLKELTKWRPSAGTLEDGQKT